MLLKLAREWSGVNGRYYLVFVVELHNLFKQLVFYSNEN